MNSISAIRPAGNSWLYAAALAQVIAGVAALVGVATSPLIGLVTAAVLVLLAVVARSLIAASQKIDTIFDEELGSPVQRHSDVRRDATHR